jgi:hypothetical protein
VSGWELGGGCTHADDVCVGIMLPNVAVIANRMKFEKGRENEERLVGFNDPLLTSVRPLIPCAFNHQPHVTCHQVNKSISSLLSSDGSFVQSVGAQPLPAGCELAAVKGVVLVGDNADDVSVWVKAASACRGRGQGGDGGAGRIKSHVTVCAAGAYVRRAAGASWRQLRAAFNRDTGDRPVRSARGEVRRARCVLHALLLARAHVQAAMAVP